MTGTYKLKAAHHIKGRLRLKVETDMDMRVFFVFFGAAIKRVKEIKTAQVSRYAASVTLYFDDRSCDAGNLITRLSEQMDFIMSLPNFTGTYEEILNALCRGESGAIEITINGDEITVNDVYGQMIKTFSRSGVFRKDTVISATTMSAGLFTLLLAPALPTPAWLVLLFFGYSSLKQYESAKVIEQLLVQSLKHEQQDEND
ncbi:hypothetical protein [Candidatus Magnetominusculus dajiuhuensis]|uniref:hypothetical protein n=1 Tax=Candidatus Magnetominusculus dajiuhuensis TaxID=3137712 RepID=UPI003B42D115